MHLVARRHLSLLIPIALLVASIAACGEETSEGPSTTDAGQDTDDHDIHGDHDASDTALDDTEEDGTQPDTDRPDTDVDTQIDVADTDLDSDTDLDATDVDLDAPDTDLDATDTDLDATDTDLDATDTDLDTTDVAEDVGDADPDSPDASEDTAQDVADADPDATPSVDCSVWEGVEGSGLLVALHRQLSERYRPIQAENDLGGHPNRYTTARHLMFSEVEWFVGTGGEGGVECVYTGFFQPVVRGEEPDNNVVNCEHTWPRARMDADRSSLLYSHQQSDLNILLPTVSGANSLRGDLPFGEPVSSLNSDYFPAQAGLDMYGDRVFRPRPERRGDVARITFYFATRWGKDIGEHEEAVLRTWAAADPVDERERARNVVIEGIQGNRNPYVDCPALLDRVPVFDEFPILDTNETLPAP